MNRFEDEPVISPSFEVVSSPEGLRAQGLTYNLHFDSSRPYVHLSDKEGAQYAELSLFGGVDVIGTTDETLDLPTISYQRDEKQATIRLSTTSTAWDKKDQVWVCRPDSVEVYYELAGEGEIADCTFFAGSYADQTMSGRFASNSRFKSIFNPEPTTSEQRVHAAAQSSSINVTGLSRAGMEDWFFTPAPYCFGANLEAPGKNGKMPGGQWLMMGVAAPIDQQHFTSVTYEGADRAFALRLAYEGQTRVSGVFRSPSVLLHFSDDPYKGTAEYIRHAREQGLLAGHNAPKTSFDWWKEPIFCGWGAQVELSDVDHSQTVQNLARQDVYDVFIDKLAAHNLHPGTITIDDKWQKTYGDNQVDTEKWPDLPDWIERRHKVGQKVLLWLKAWDNEGLSDDLCVTTRTGKPVTVDPSNPGYEAYLRQQVDHMLGPDGYNADGFKIDFTARTPTGQSLQRHGEQWGTSLLHRYLKTIYDQAKQTKPDALVVTHTPSPWFNDVTDMIRLNDINGGMSVSKQMEHRAKIAQVACPDLLIDTDNWPMPSIEQWRRYLKLQPSLGVMALYFTDTVAGAPMETQDYAAIRRRWRKWRLQNGLAAFLP